MLIFWILAICFYGLFWFLYWVISTSGPTNSPLIELKSNGCFEGTTFRISCTKAVCLQLTICKEKGTWWIQHLAKNSEIVSRLSLKIRHMMIFKVFCYSLTGFYQSISDKEKKGHLEHINWGRWGWFFGWSAASRFVFM